ncbi:hopanoid biosynthesis-associated protein HpnK [Hyphomicrobium sp. ghe19]|uniref:hopanoid biosynthesis-associated protein HpnK n=1 Tax=Hyphomicrobium sp. ghe19 TaxID=2682968 RepID=UPI0013671A6C|nr:Carbohydrate deacetylase [Hyphomicrobium sp. ghe19]
MKSLIVTADDFGMSIPVNDGIEASHSDGILSATSLMCGGDAFSDAVERAKRLPNLGVGLHIHLVDSRPVLPPEKIPLLVDRDGCFSNNPELFGFNLYFSGEMRRQAEAEIEAQFQRFESTGLVMDHINGHHHFHMHPAVTDAIAKFAPRYGSPPVRYPVEPFWPSWEAGADKPVRRLFNWALYASLTSRMRRKLKSAGLALNDHIFGVNDTGAMTEKRILAYLDHLPDGVTELYAHPAMRMENQPQTYGSAEEYSGLVSPVVRAKVAALGLQPLTFRAAFTA